MNQIKIGQLICALRKEKGYTRLEPANKLAVSDKAVSKWARGLGSCFGIARSTDYSRKSFSISIGRFVMFDKERILAHFNQHKCQ